MNAQINNKTYENGIDLILSECERISRVTALRSLAGALQFSMISTASFILFEQENKERMEELGMTDLDQRNKQDEEERGDEADKQSLEDKGLETREDPRERLNLTARVYDDVIRLLGTLRPTQFELPRSVRESVQAFIDNSGTFRPANETVMAKLTEAGIDDAELRDAGEQAAARRLERLNKQAPQLLQLIEDAQGNPDYNLFTKLPLQSQLRFMIGTWKGMFSRRRQIVLYISSSGKLDQLSDTHLLKKDMEIIEDWCRDFEYHHSAIIESLLDVGVQVPSMDDAIAWSKSRSRK